MKKMLALLLAFVLALPLVASSESATAALQEMYAQAELLMVQGDYAGAAAKFESLGAYSDASQMTMYCKAIAAAETLGLYSMAVDAFNDLGDFKDSKQMSKYYEGRAYEAAGIIDITTASASGLEKALWHCEEAEKIYGELVFFKDSLTRMATCSEKIKDIKNEQSERATAEKEAIYQEALTLEQNGEYAAAIKIYQTIESYKDSSERIVTCQAGIQNNKYDTAVTLMNSRKYREAYSIFVELDGYRDSKNKAMESLKLYFQEVVVGTYVFFGTYEQDGNLSNGKEAIEWLVIANQNNRLLLISRYALERKLYYEERANKTWETCTLRKWLNNEFLNDAFSLTEQTWIPTVDVPADKNPTYNTAPGNATQDKVFLLSSKEVERYLPSDSEKQCSPTTYAEQNGVLTNHTEWCWWWLRSPGYEQKYAACVNRRGTIDDWGSFVNDSYVGVRPAIWIELAP